MAPKLTYTNKKKDANWDGASGANCNAQSEHWRSNKSDPKKKVNGMAFRKKKNGVDVAVSQSLHPMHPPITRATA